MKKVLLLTVICVPLTVLCICLESCDADKKDKHRRYLRKMEYSNGGQKEYYYDDQNRVNKIISIQEAGRTPNTACVNYTANTITIDSNTGLKSVYRLNDDGYIQTHTATYMDYCDKAIKSEYFYEKGYLSRIESSAYRLTYNWKDGNIASSRYVFLDQRDSPGTIYTLTYTYTDIKNRFNLATPFETFLNDEFDDITFKGTLSRNLPATCREYDPQGNLLSDYSYTYELDNTGQVTSANKINNISDYTQTFTFDYY